MTKTGYEIIGMIKDGNAPKKIRYIGEIYIFNDDFNDYQLEEGGLLYITKHLTDKFEIIENENDFKNNKDKLQELGIIDNFTCAVGMVDNSNGEEYIHKLFDQQEEIIIRLNELIRIYLKNIQDKQN